MAKNKPDKDAQKEAESMNPLDLLRKEIEKKWGKNVMNSASSIMD
jgi:hypothetical protein